MDNNSTCLVRIKQIRFVKRRAQCFVHSMCSVKFDSKSRFQSNSLSIGIGASVGPDLLSQPLSPPQNPEDLNGFLGTSEVTGQKGQEKGKCCAGTAPVLYRDPSPEARLLAKPFFLVDPQGWPSPPKRSHPSAP